MSLRNFKIYRGDDERGELVNYQCEVTEGMVVLDVIHRIQADQANDLACRWNCKAGKCGSCSIEINGKPRLECMTRMNEFEEDQTLTITPLKSFPVIKDIVTDVGDTLVQFFPQLMRLLYLWKKMSDLSLGYGTDVASAEGIICVEKIAGLNPSILNYDNIPSWTRFFCSFRSSGIPSSPAPKYPFSEFMSG